MSPALSTAPDLASSALRVRVRDSLDRLRKYFEALDFAGYDPYDALNSPIIRLVCLGQKYPRIACTQLLKRLPVNVRPLLLIKKGHNPKGIGLFLWGYAKLYHIYQDPQYLNKVDQLLDLLAGLRSPNRSGNAWGYNFDWQSRAFFVPKGTPTVVNTSFIGHALLDAYRYTGREQALDLALSTHDFLLKDLNRTEDDTGHCFSYTPIDRLTVHNANLLGASLLIRLFQHNRDEETRDAALRSLRYSMTRQRPDGSWWYADTDYQKWIDSFHTGFNLQSVKFFLDDDFGLEYRDAFDRGVRFYVDHFFLADGTPKYFHDRTFPIDVHSYAQSVVVLSRLGGCYQQLAARVADRMIETFQDPRGFFYFQQTPRYTVKIPYMRWSQAWAFHALTDYLLASGEVPA